MSENEELLTTEMAGTDESIDIDDVEGHGLKEVAAGLGAAAVLAGGGAAALQHTSSSLPNAPSRDHVVAAVDQVGQQTWDGSMATASNALGAADDTVDGTSRTAGAAVSAADRVADGTLASAGKLASSATSLVGSTEKAALSTTRNVAHGATATVDAGVDKAADVADGVSVANAASTVNKNVSSVDLAGKTATVLKITTTTTAGALTTVNAVLSDTGANAGSSQGTGWITFKVGDAVVGSVQVKAGQASITLNTTDIAGRTITATYSGDGVHASCSNSTQG
jgi:hypothetical protein